MMRSKRSLEGYVLVDNSHAPGPTHGPRGEPLFGARGFNEAPTLTCSHCQNGMIVQPLRTRERAHCRKCDHYICDECALIAKLNGGECRPMKKILDVAQERAFQALRG